MLSIARHKRESVSFFAALVFFLLSAMPIAKGGAHSRAELEQSFAPMLQRVHSSVYDLLVVRTIIDSPENISGAASSSLLDEGLLLETPRRERNEQITGGAVLVDNSGLILSGAHVVARATSIHARNERGELQRAFVIHSDPVTDLALLRLENGAKGVSPLEFADSDALRIGDIVFALGNPLNLGRNSSLGIISGMGLAQSETGFTNFMLRTDAPINPGNSGGALVTTSGRIAGIISARRVPQAADGAVVGIGFAVPAKLAARYVQKARKGGDVLWPWLGARTRDARLERAIYEGSPTRPQLSIVRLLPESPAQKAGLRVGDIIARVDGFPASSRTVLNYRLATAGKNVITLSGRRGQTERQWQFPVELPPFSPSRQTVVFDNGLPFSGASISNLSPALAQIWGYASNASGTIIERIAKGSHAERAGFQSGDRIVTLDGTRVRNTQALQALVSKSGSYIQLILDRRGRRQTRRYRTDSAR